MEGLAEALLGLLAVVQVGPALPEEGIMALHPVAVAVPVARGVSLFRVSAVPAVSASHPPSPVQPLVTVAAAVVSLITAILVGAVLPQMVLPAAGAGRDAFHGPTAVQAPVRTTVTITAIPMDHSFRATVPMAC
jgi:hypothetical protein